MKVRSKIMPQAVEFTEKYVLVASNIVEYSEEVDGHTMSGYEYDCNQYTKDEYLLQQAAKIEALQEELAAAKILLGVDE